MHKGINKTIGSTILKRDLEHAKSYKLWAQTASKLQQTAKKDAKVKPSKLLQTKCAQLKRALQDQNISRLLILIEECCMRNFGDILNPSLYEPYGFPQEPLIEQFLSLLEAAIKWVAGCECLSREEKDSFFKALQSRLGNSALLLSGGSSLGMLHIGVAKGLLDSSILPTIIHGSSAGSIVAAIICVSLEDEIEEALKLTKLQLLAFDEFEEEGNFMAKILKRFKRVATTGAAYDSDVLVRCMRHNLGDLTFKEAWLKTGRILNIAVSSSTGYEMPKMLNYLTAPDVVIWSAVVASCAIPKIFLSASLLVKTRGPGKKLVPWHATFHENIDGSVESDLPIKSLAEMFNVNNVIVSQVNVHVVPFIFNRYPTGFVERATATILRLFKRELIHRIGQLKRWGLCPRFLVFIYKVLRQTYHGNITIVPKLSLSDYFVLFSNPSLEFIRECILRGERALWPSVFLVKNSQRIEKLIQDLLNDANSNADKQSRTTIPSPGHANK